MVHKKNIVIPLGNGLSPPNVNVNTSDILRSWDEYGMFIKGDSMNPLPDNYLQITRTIDGFDICWKIGRQRECGTIITDQGVMSSNGSFNKTLLVTPHHTTSNTDADIQIMYNKGELSLCKAGECIIINELGSIVGATTYVNRDNINRRCASVEECIDIDNSFLLDEDIVHNMSTLENKAAYNPIYGTMCSINTNLSTIDKHNAMNDVCKSKFGNIGTSFQDKDFYPRLNEIPGLSCDIPIYLPIQESDEFYNSIYYNYFTEKRTETQSNFT